MSEGVRQWGPQSEKVSACVEMAAETPEVSGHGQSHASALCRTSCRDTAVPLSVAHRGPQPEAAPCYDWPFAVVRVSPVVHPLAQSTFGCVKVCLPPYTILPVFSWVVDSSENRNFLN